MRNPDNSPLDDLVFDCCQELFAAYELAAEARPRESFPATERLAFCGVMGFGGKLMRGALVLATTKEPLEQTNPSGMESQRDWVCELANQLMGRIKNRLLSLGVEIHLATPAGLSGDNLSAAPGKLRAPQVFEAANGFICVWIDCEYVEGFALPTTAASTTSDDPALSEGEAVLF
jgi:hypothetical protein